MRSSLRAGMSLRISYSAMEESEWRPIADAPHDRDRELAVTDAAGVHALIFSVSARR